MEFNFLQSLPSVAPEIGLTVLAVVVLLLDSYAKDMTTRRNIAFVAALGMAFIAITPLIWSPPPEGAPNLFWGGMVRYDALAQIFKVMVIAAGAITSLIALDDKHVRRMGEFHLIIIIATLGASLMSAAADLIMLFIALETLSIPLYILATLGRRDGKSAESGMKYFLFGGFASAIMLFGLSLLFGFTGATSLEAVAAGLSGGTIIGDNAIPVLGALIMIVAGFGFKISIVPFHFWTPDVYEGAPTPVAAYVSVASKAASFALILRFFMVAFPESVVIGGVTVNDFWISFAVVSSILTMTLGNVLALRQSNIKRLLAYSSIAQAGYTLIGVAAAADSNLGVASVAFYMFMYTFTNLLVFAGVILWSNASGSEEIRDMAGMNRRSPWLALMITIALLSLGGIPPAAGFFGKFFLFQAAVEANLVGLAIIGVLNAIVALYYYLVVIKVMYVDPGKDEDQAVGISRPYGWALGIAAVAVILLGTIGATPVFDWARSGALAIVAGF